MINLLLIISIILILVSYTRIILIYLSTKSINIDDMNGFDLAKELTLKYDEINIVESKEINISKYNFKRRVIRLTTKDYNSNNIFNLSKITLLSGYSIINIANDKYLSLLGRVLPNIDYLNKSSLIALFISILARTTKDAKISIILLIIILIYQYLINEINIISKNETMKKLNSILKTNYYNKILQVEDIYLLINKISFITTLILIFRNILIIIN